MRPAYFAYVHAPLVREGGAETWHAQRVDPLIPHQWDFEHHLDESRESRVREITGPLYSLRHATPMWAALRFLTFGLRETKGDTRITFLWIAIEALFGRTDAEPGLSKELYRRMAAFFGTGRHEQLASYEIAKAGWLMRCKAVHGGRTADVESHEMLERIIEAERMLRTAFNRILRDPQLLATFIDEDSREALVAAGSAAFRRDDGMANTELR